VPEDVAILLQDAQTSGGLLLATPDPGSLVAELSARHVEAALIGEITAPAAAGNRAGAITVTA
jgi:hypothetical protein